MTVHKHQQHVRANGQRVMPFDLDKTIHIFTKTPDGGVQIVRTREATDQTQIDLVRKHLQAEAQKFSHGDFSDPASIHGNAMPGLATLIFGAPYICFDYHDVPDGGKITYHASDRKLIEAIHAWFDAQVHDHGHDAMHGSGENNL